MAYGDITMNTTPSIAYPGSLELYCREIGKTPLLTKDEERDLAIRNQRGEPAAREHLIRANLRLVVSVARKFSGMGLAIEDLIAEGNRGLIKAVERYDPAVGASMSTYAVWWIRQCILRSIENHGRTIRLPAHILTQVRKMRAAATELTQILGREPDDIELAEHLGTSGDRLATTRAAFQPMHSLDEITGGDLPLSEKLAAESNTAGDPFCAACQECDCDRVQQILGKLPARLRFVIEVRFGIGGRRYFSLRRCAPRAGSALSDFRLKQFLLNGADERLARRQQTRFVQLHESLAHLAQFAERSGEVATHPPVIAIQFERAGEALPRVRQLACLIKRQPGP